MRKLIILLAAVAFVFAVTMPAAADVNFSGYAATNTYWSKTDNPGDVENEKDFLFDLDPCSRLSANFAEGPVTGYVEISSKVGLRHWWGTWNFGAGTLGVGQTWVPDFSCIGSSRFDCGAIGVLDPACTVRAPQVMLTIGGLKIAAVAYNIPEDAIAVTYKGVALDDPEIGLPVFALEDTETSIPKMVASYNLNVAMVGVKLWAGYQTYKAEDTAGECFDVDSYVLGLTGNMGFGPLTVNAMVYTGQNLNEYGALDDATNPPALWDGESLHDSDFTAFGVDLAYKVSDMATITAGLMMGEGKVDVEDVTLKDETTTYHANVILTMAKGVTITPEFGVIDYKNFKADGETIDEPKITYYGIHWRIAF